MSKSSITTAMQFWRRQRGFTMVELVTIIVIVGIISVVALPRFAGDGAFRNRATADQVAAALRYAQKVAIASHNPVIVNVTNAPPGVPVNCGTAVVAGVINCLVPEDVVLGGTLVVGGTLTVTFDFMGAPIPNGAASAVVGTTTINIEAVTGYVH